MPSIMLLIRLSAAAADLFIYKHVFGRKMASATFTLQMRHRPKHNPDAATT
jgi:hypothetical protein